MVLASYRDPGTGQLVPIPTGISQEQGDARYVQQDGGVMLADPTVPLGVATKQYADRFVSVPTGFRNVIRNGDMQIAQRGNGPWQNGYGIDGWILYASSVGAPSTWGRSVQAVGSGSPLAVLTVTGQTAYDTWARLDAKVEDVNTLAGRTIAVSFSAKAASGAPKIAVQLVQNFGTGGSPSTEVGVFSSAVTLSTTLTRYSVTMTLPSVAGKTLGTSNNHNLRLSLWVSGEPSFISGLPVGVATQNNTFSITDVQLEEGPVATPFERLPYQQQLAWCQRYFQRYEDSGTYRAFASGFADGPTDSYVLLPYLQRMRVRPSFTKQGTFVLASGPAIAITDVRLSGQSSVDNATLIVNTTNSGYAQGRACFLQTVTSPGIIDFSAEL